MQKLQLSISEPCHENWQQMTPTDQGRFCNACAKEVIDFSMMTDTEVLNYFTSLSHEKVCGRALPEQLNRTISYPKEPRKRLFWYWNYIVMFFMFFGKGNNVKAQGNVKMITTEEISKKRSANISEVLAGKVGGVTGLSHQPVKGKVTDVNANPRSFSTAKPGTETKVRLGQVNVVEKGRAPLYVVDGIVMTGGTDINPDDIDDITVLNSEKALVIFGSDASGGAIVVTSRKSKLKNLDTVVVRGDMNSIKSIAGGLSIMRKTTRFTEVKALVNTILADSLKIYPNPVQKGYTFSVSLKLKQAGSHSFQISDAAGRIVLQKKFNDVVKEYGEKVETDSRWSSGVYYIRIYDNKNKLINKAKFLIK